MTFNECPGGNFEACPGGSKTTFSEGKGGAFYVSSIMSRGKSTIPIMASRGYFTPIRDFPI